MDASTTIDLPRRAGPRNPDRAFLGHPSGLGVIAFTEAWERFSYYGMQSILVLYWWTSYCGPDVALRREVDADAEEASTCDVPDRMPG